MKGFVGTGASTNDFWEYDPAADTWTQKANFEGGVRNVATGFSIQSKGYIGTGGYFYKVFCEYNPVADVWTKKADFGGEQRLSAVGFSIGNYGFIDTGFNGSSSLRDFWKYDPDDCSGFTVYADVDGDLYGNLSDSYFAVDCIVPAGYVKDSVDCNDANATIHPGAEEIRNGLDDNCNGAIDEGLIPDTWIRKTDFGGIPRSGAVGFSIGSKGYLGTGKYDNSDVMKDFWEYDPLTEVWSQKADVGGVARSFAAGFSIGSKGYIGTGLEAGTFWPSLRDFWEYEVATNSWSQKADVGGWVRTEAIGFSIGEKGYIGTGYIDYALADFWEYEPVSDAWTQKADFGGGRRSGAIGFSAGGKGYIGTGWSFDAGENNFSASSDFWEYDPVADVWKQKADYAGGMIAYGSGFSIGSKGFAGTGTNHPDDLNTFWEYDPVLNSWNQMADFGGEARWGATGFSIGNKGYIGTGGYRNDFWEFTPEMEPFCSAPTGEYTTKIKSTSAKLNWNAVVDAFRYKVRYRPEGASNWIKVTDVKFNFRVISGLNPNKLYYWEVKSVCAENVSSSWSPMQSFTTLAYRLAAEQIATLELYPNPFSENFTLDLHLYPGADQSANIFLLNAHGQVMYSEKAVAGNGLLTTEITMPSTASSGWFVVRVVLNDQVMERKLLYNK